MICLKSLIAKKRGNVKDLMLGNDQFDVKSKGNLITKTSQLELFIFKLSNVVSGS